LEIGQCAGKIIKINTERKTAGNFHALIISSYGFENAPEDQN
jgi:hypothetical protein